MDSLVEENLINQMRFAHHAGLLSEKHWAREFATIRCDLGRQVGKTSWIRSKAKTGDLIIASTYVMKQSLIRSMPLADVITQEDLKRTDYSWPRYNRIFIDEPRKLDLNLAYDIFARDTKQLFIILGS